jgi:hypothetical protein
MRSRSRIWIVCGLGLLVLLTVLALVLRPVTVARSLKSDLTRMGGTRISILELEKWAQHQHGDVNCDHEGCTVEISNDFLQALRLAPPVRFVAGVTLVEGRVAATSLSLVSVRYDRNRPEGASTLLTIAYEPSRYFRGRLVEPYVRHGPTGKVPQLTYIASPQCDLRAIAAARNIDVWCLARLGGCMTGTQQAPDAWSFAETARSVERQDDRGALAIAGRKRPQ